MTGIVDGATVSLAVITTAGPTLPIAESKINKPTVVVHGAGATLVAKTTGAGGFTNLTLQFNPI